MRKQKIPDESAVSSRLLLHQLRNLLQPLQTHLDLLSAREPRDPQLRQGVAQITTDLSMLESFLGRVSILVRDLELDCTEVDLPALVASVWHAQRSKWSGPVPEFSCELPTQRARLDERLFTLALSALLENALEASAAHEGGYVRVTAEHGRGSQLIISNRGSLNREVPRTDFTPFFTTKSSSGAGLGLSIAARIITAHGGTLRLEQRRDTTAAVISLPLELAQAQQGR